MSNVSKAEEAVAKINNFKEEFMNIFMNRVRQKTPVETGALKDGWYIEKHTDGLSLNNDEDYAVYLELGTENIAPVAMVQTTIIESSAIIKEAKQKVNL